jgi:hypothetical protein
MITTDKTARQLYAEVRANPQRVPFGFGNKAVLVNIDVQQAYTRTDLFKTAYESDPRQIEYINRLSASFRRLGWPVVWTTVAFLDSAEDAGVWGTRTDTPDSLQNIKYGSERAAFDERADVQPGDIRYIKRMPSAFFETPLPSLLVWHQGRHGAADRRLDLRLRARHGGRQPVARLSHHRAGGVRGRQARELPLREPDRSGASSTPTCWTVAEVFAWLDGCGAA